jgi:hypothetical protein
MKPSLRFSILLNWYTRQHRWRGAAACVMACDHVSFEHGCVWPGQHVTVAPAWRPALCLIASLRQMERLQSPDERGDITLTDWRDASYSLASDGLLCWAGIWWARIEELLLITWATTRAMAPVALVLGPPMNITRLSSIEIEFDNQRMPHN